MPTPYAIIDIETTGGRAARDKITEIAVVLHDGAQILNTYSTLINPECYIPHGITQLTGITQEMVADAPLFQEVARDIVEWTEGAIFVAHNVRFDYSFVRAAFAELGYTYSRRQLCTVRLSRQAFPGLASYSLDSLISYLGIAVGDRHRALGDALATAELLRRILQRQENEVQARLMINMGVRESRLPKSFSLERIHALPEACGVYYFHDAQGHVLYVGKSINIRKRVAEHFADQTDKARQLQEQAADVSYELTGSELIALLLESREIKRLRPPVNRAQRRRRFPYVLHYWTDEAGYLRFGLRQANTTQRRGLQVVSEYPSAGQAKGRLSRARHDHELCACLCGLQYARGSACFEYHLRRCRGACVSQEPAEDYNERARQALEDLRNVFDEDFFLIDQGRYPGELAIVLVEGGMYRGHGYLDAELLNRGDARELREAILPCEGNPETNRIILGFLSKNGGIRVLRV
jgi:DNA polymerase-3 subunit epsilon